MNGKRSLGLILFAIFTTAGLFFGAHYLSAPQTKDNNITVTAPASANSAAVTDGPTLAASETAENIVSEEPWLSANPSDTGAGVKDHQTVTPDPDIDHNPGDGTNIEEEQKSEEGQNSEEEQSSGEGQKSEEQNQGKDLNPEEGQTQEEVSETVAASANTVPAPQLILDSTKIDYMAYIPEIITDSGLETALDITNPDIELAAKAAILFDADTKEVLFYKNPVEVMFPASTAKLLSSLVILQWCKEEEQVTVGDEITMIAPDSSKANIHEGQILTVHSLLEGMLLPSGNDAAYAAAAYVGRKSLKDEGASKEEAIEEFVRLMNKKAISLGVKNSCFKTPDGYDAIGQYTTAYDMGMIGVAASKNEVITQISHKSKSRNIFVSGEDVTWNSTNKLVTRYSGQYYSHAIGLKTGTSTMAGDCIIAAAEENGRKVVCVVMASTAEGRWEDAIALLKYGLE